MLAGEVQGSVLVMEGHGVVESLSVGAEEIGSVSSSEGQ